MAETSHPSRAASNPVNPIDDIVRLQSCCRHGIDYVDAPEPVISRRAALAA
jgi:hypothetical protein